jgi:hypothetical protein
MDLFCNDFSCLFLSSFHRGGFGFFSKREGNAFSSSCQLACYVLKVLLVVEIGETGEYGGKAGGERSRARTEDGTYHTE